MQRFSLLLIAIFLAGCGSSEAAVQTAIAETETARPTNTPTLTLNPTKTLTPTTSPYLSPESYTNIKNIDGLTFTTAGSGLEGLSATGYCLVTMTGSRTAFERALLMCDHVQEDSDYLPHLMAYFVYYSVEKGFTDASNTWLVDQYRAGFMMTLSTLEYKNEKTFGNVHLAFWMSAKILSITTTPAR